MLRNSKARMLKTLIHSSNTVVCNPNPQWPYDAGLSVSTRQPPVDFSYKDCNYDPKIRCGQPSPTSLSDRSRRFTWSYFPTLSTGTLLVGFLDASGLFPSFNHPRRYCRPGPRQVQIRKYSTWTRIPYCTFTCDELATTEVSTSSFLVIHNPQLHLWRIATDRQCHKDHIQWARIHGAALEHASQWVV